ncbi:hypothetical protein D3C75_1081430 [compost metagenome]
MVAHVQPVAVRERVMVLFSTGAGALRIVQPMVPLPSVALPLAEVVQLDVDGVPPTLARSGSSP